MLRKLWVPLTHEQRGSAARLAALLLIGTALETVGIGLVVPVLGLMTQSDNAGPDVTPPAGDRASARALGTRVADAAKRWNAAA